MANQLLNELHQAPLDTPGQERLRAIFLRTLAEARRQLPEDLRGEFDRLTHVDGQLQASSADLRIVHAQLVGWLDGIFAGAQLAALVKHLV